MEHPKFTGIKDIREAYSLLDSINPDFRDKCELMGIETPIRFDSLEDLYNKLMPYEPFTGFSIEGDEFEYRIPRREIESSNLFIDYREINGLDMINNVWTLYFSAYAQDRVPENHFDMDFVSAMLMQMEGKIVAYKMIIPKLQNELFTRENPHSADYRVCEYMLMSEDPLTGLQNDQQIEEILNLLR